MQKDSSASMTSDKRIMPLFERLDQERSWRADLRRWQQEYERSCTKIRSYKATIDDFHDQGFMVPRQLDMTLYILDNCFADYKDKAISRIVPAQTYKKITQNIGLDGLFYVPITQIRSKKAIALDFRLDSFSDEELKDLGAKLEDEYRKLSWPIQPHARYGVRSEDTEKLDLITQIGLKASHSFRQAYFDQDHIGYREQRRSRGKVLGHYDENYVIDGVFRGEETYKVLGFEEGEAELAKDALVGYGILIHTDFGDLVAYRPRNGDSREISIGSAVTFMQNEVRDVLQFPQDFHSATILDID